MPDAPLMIETMYAFVATEADGSEGLCAFKAPDGSWMPMVGADEARLDSLRPIAKDIAARAGRSVRLVRFSHREELETIR